MNREDIKAIVTDIFRKAFDNESLEISDVTTANDIPGWDSLMHITLVTTIEERFNIHFKLKEVTGLQNVGDTISLVEEKLK